MTKALMRKYLNGECSNQEEQKVIQFITTDEGKELMGQLADELWKEDIEVSSSIDAEKLFDNIIKQIPAKRNVVSWPIKTMKWVASILLLASASFLVFQHISKTEQVAVAPIEMVVKSTTKGQKSTIMLSDGSKVTLNSLSEITYPRYFSDSSRHIELKGEAFFEVAKDKNRPFIVSTGNLETIALGTSFNINCRTDAQKVSLATGKVLINTYDLKNYALLPGEALEMDIVKGAAKKTVFDKEKILAWKDGIIIFEDADIAEITTALELWYDVKIQLSNIKNNNKYTGKFENESLRNVLESMSFALDFNFVMNGKKVNIIYNQNN